MKRKYAVAFLLFAAFFVACAFTGCDDPTDDACVFQSTQQTVSVNNGDSDFDFKPYFRLTLDGLKVDVPVTVDVSLVNFGEAGSYTVKATCTVKGKVYEASLTAVVGEREYSVSVLSSDASVFAGASGFDYFSMFTVRVDGETVSAADGVTDHSAVNLKKEGNYKVKYSYEGPDGVVYTSEATLTVKANDVKITAKKGFAEINQIDYDFSQMFSVTVNGEEYPYSADCVDVSEVDFASDGLYSVEYVLTYAEKVYKAKAYIAVGDASGAEIAKAFEQDYSNRTVSRVINEQGDTYNEIFYLTSDAARFVDNSGVLAEHIFVLSGGEATRTLKYDEANGVYRIAYDSVWTNYFLSHSWNDLDAADFVYNAATDSYGCVSSKLAEYKKLVTVNEEYTITGLSITLKDGFIKQITATASNGAAFKCTLSQIGATQVSVPDYSDDISVYVPSDLPMEFFVGTEVDFKTYFRLSVNGTAVPVTDDMITSNVDSSRAGDYTVRFYYSAHNAELERILNISYKEVSALTAEQIAALNAAFSADYTNYTATRLYSDEMLADNNGVFYVTADLLAYYMKTPVTGTSGGSEIIAYYNTLWQYYADNGSGYSKFTYMVTNGSESSRKSSVSYAEYLFPDLSELAAYLTADDLTFIDGKYTVLSVDAAKALCMAFGTTVSSLGDYKFAFTVSQGRIGSVYMTAGINGRTATFTFTDFGATELEPPEEVFPSLPVTVTGFPASFVKGADIDYSLLFSVVVDGQKVETDYDSIDYSQVVKNLPGTYKVGYTHSLNGIIYKAYTDVTVTETADDALSELLTDINNFTVDRYVYDDEASYDVVLKRTANSAYYKDSYYEYAMMLSSEGSIFKAYYKSGTEWKLSTVSLAGYGFVMDFSFATKLSADMFYKVGDTYYVVYTYLSTFAYDIMGLDADFVQFGVKWTNGTLCEITAVMVDGTRMINTVSAIGETAVDMPQVQADVKFTGSNAQCSAGSGFDFKTMFYLIVDGIPVDVTDDMVDASAANLQEEGSYRITAQYTFNGYDYTAEAVLTVTAASEQMTFKQIFEKDYGNVTLAKYSGSSSAPAMYYVKGAAIYAPGSYSNYIFVKENDGSLTRYTVKEGAVTDTQVNTSAKPARIDLVFALSADEFVYDSASGTYKYSGAEAVAIAAANAAYNPLSASIEITLSGNSVSEIKISYTTQLGDSYFRYVLSNVGSTEFDIPEGVAVPSSAYEAVLPDKKD